MNFKPANLNNNQNPHIENNRLQIVGDIDYGDFFLFKAVFLIIYKL